MDRPIASQRRTRLLWRMSLGLCAAAMFVGVASVIKPPPRSATATQSPNTSARSTLAAPGAKTPAHQGATPAATGVPADWKLLGMLESRQHIVLCYGTPDGPRYSVYTIHGELLKPGMHADEVYRSFPDVDIENMHLEPGQSGPVMLMDAD